MTKLVNLAFKFVSCADKQNGLLSVTENCSEFTSLQKHLFYLPMFIKLLCLYSQAQTTPGQCAHYSQILLSCLDEDVQHFDSLFLSLRHKLPNYFLKASSQICYRSVYRYMETKTFNMAFSFKKKWNYQERKCKYRSLGSLSGEKHVSGYEKGNSPSFPRRKTRPLIKNAHIFIHAF